MGAPYALSSDLVSAWPAKSLEVAQYIDGQLPLIAMTQNAQTGTTYTLAATDFTKLVTLSNASPVTVTVPLESSVAWVAGTQLRLMNLGAGLVTVAGAVGVTINGSPLTLAQYKEGTLTKTATNTWTFTGSAAAPGMTLISTVALSGSSVTVNNVFSATYDNYMLAMTHTLAAGSQLISLQLRVGGVTATGANYVYQQLNAGGSTVAASRSGGTTAALVGYSSTQLAFDTVYIASPAVAVATAMRNLNAGSTSGAIIIDHASTHNLAIAYDGFVLAPGGSTFTGSVSIYGLAK